MYVNGVRVLLSQLVELGKCVRDLTLLIVNNINKSAGPQPVASLHIHTYIYEIYNTLKRTS